MCCVGCVTLITVGEERVAIGSESVRERKGEEEEEEEESLKNQTKEEKRRRWCFYV